MGISSRFWYSQCTFCLGLVKRLQKAGNKTAYTVCDIGANIVQVMTGGDFVLFGPIDNAKIAFPAVAQTDMFIAEAAADFGTEAVEDHQSTN